MPENNPKPKRGSYDAIIIGGGHNGLTAAAYLALARRRVLVLERGEALGGAASTAPVFPGFRVDTGSYDVSGFMPQIVHDLGLEGQGLRLLHSPALAFAPQPGGRPLTLWRSPDRTLEEVTRLSQRDAARFPAFLELMMALTDVLRVMMTLTPPDLPQVSLAQVFPWAPVGWQVKRLGKRDMMEFMRILPMPVADFLDEWFETPLLKAALGMPGVLGSMQGPRASGTAFMMLYHSVGWGGGLWTPTFAQGGAGALSEALANAARAFGAEVRTAAPVRSILVEGDRASGVLLEDGSQIKARVVLSSADPRTTFFDLVGAPHFPVRFVREVRAIKFRGSTARINLALSGLPRFEGPVTPGDDPAEHLSGRILICPELDYLERAYDDAKHGRLSAEPALDIAIPSVSDPSRAPAGQHVMAINVRYAPYHLDGDWDAQRDELAERVLDTLEVYAPNLRDCILHRQVLTPLDLERDFGLPEGDFYHGQMGLDQLLFMRPVAGYGRYRTPLQGLYLCGAGTHPGGGVTGAPGMNAAREVLKDL